jgi:hypothetical protein
VFLLLQNNGGKECEEEREGGRNERIDGGGFE